MESAAFQSSVASSRHHAVYIPCGAGVAGWARNAPGQGEGDPLWYRTGKVL